MLTELFAGKKGIIFGVPGAFTPGCSKVCMALRILTNRPIFLATFRTSRRSRARGLEHVPHLSNFQVDVVACVSVNDPFVMAAWGEAHHVGDKIRMLADTRVRLALLLRELLCSCHEPFLLSLPLF